MKTRQSLTAISLFLIFVCCSSQDNSKSEEILPPIELIESNIDLSENVCHATVLSFSPEDTIYSDSGTPGYLFYIIDARVIKTYKGNLKKGEVFQYRNFVEFSEEKFQYDEVIIFLNKDNKSDQFHVIEFGQFAATTGLINLVDQLFK